MFLSQTAEYCFRAMAVLASHPEGESLRAIDLAGRTGIPVQYLAKIMRRLVVRKLVSSRRGHGGGFTLIRKPSEIRFIEILRATDYELRPDRCAFGIGSCDARNPCSLHPTWSRLNESVAEWARGHTLADLGPRRKPERGQN